MAKFLDKEGHNFYGMGEAVGHKIARRGGGRVKEIFETKFATSRTEACMAGKKSTSSLHLSIILYILMNKTSLSNTTIKSKFKSS